jgi:PAS domain S-box-containing protein
MLNGILPRLLGLTLATVLPFTALFGGVLWDQWREDDVDARREVQIKTQIIASEVDYQLNSLAVFLSGLSRALSTDPADASANDAKLRRVKAEWPSHLGKVSNVLLFEPDGRNIGTSMEGEVSRIEVGDRDFFKSVLAGAPIAIGEPVKGRTTGRWVFTLARPIHDDDGKVRAVLVTGIDAVNFQDALDLRHLPTGSVVRIVSKAGALVARSIDAESRIGQVVKPFRLGDVANVEWADGVTRLTASTPTSLVPWSVSVGFPPDYVTESIKKRLTWGGAFGAAALLTTLALAWFLATRLSRPLRELTADAQALAAGNLSHRTCVDASGEVGVLASTFNAMASSLEQRHKDLELMQKAARIEAAERKRVQDLERQAKETLEAIIDASPAGVVCIDTDRNVTLWSRTAEQIYGYTAQEALGEQIRILPAGKAEESAALFQRAIRGEVVRHVEVQRQRKDGTLVDIDLSAAPMHGPDGSVRGIVWTHHDVSQRKETERQLVQAQKMDAIGQLTGGIAHDLNNLLLVIIGNLDLLHEKLAADSSNEELIKASIDAATSGATLANGLLGFARKQALQPETIDTKALVLDHVAFLKRAIGPNIEVKTELSEDTFPVYADPTQLKCALMNLIVNARDAMPSGGTLTVRTYNAALDETSTDVSLPRADCAVIEVCDSGIGISPDNLQRIFEPFFTTKEVGKGTGLGLSMVFGFFQQSKGKVIVTSEVGRGTTFRAYLPRTEGQVQLQSSSAEPHAEMKGRERILVVDDDDMVRAIVLKHLTALGYDTIQATSASEALNIVERGETFDLLFTDMVMPGSMSGLDLADAVRAKRPDVKVLLTSGYPDLKERHDSFMDFALIKKPYRRPDLQAAIRALLDNKQIAA